MQFGYNKNRQEEQPIDPSTLDLSLDPRLLGAATTLEPHAASCSASRSAMRASFLTQMLVLKGATPRRLFTGAEREYGRYTMSIEVPCKCKVIKVVNKYPRQLGIHSFKYNSETTIIYESLENGELGTIVIPNFYWNHKVFGFAYNINPIVKTLSPGALLEKGTVLADTPSINPSNGDYKYGIETSTAFLTVPGIIEDGIVISESYRQKLRTRGYGSKVVEWGGNTFPLNLYGKYEDDYRYFPDIGERIRSDGVIFAMRDYDPILAVSNMCSESLMHVDHTFDKVTYVPLSSIDGNEMPMVEDVQVWHTHNSDLWKTPPLMEGQVRSYHEATKIYNTSIHSVYEEELIRRKQNLKTTNEFHAKLVRARISDNNIRGTKLPKSLARTFRRAKLDDWRIEIKYGWDITPNIGFKITDLHGGKGVICSIWPDERMPVDDEGNRFDCIVGGDKNKNII